MKRFLQHLYEAKRKLGSDQIDLFHGTIENPTSFSRGIETNRGKGVGGQGSGFYGFTQRRQAGRHIDTVQHVDKATPIPQSPSNRRMTISTRTHVSNLIPDTELIQRHAHTLGVLADWHDTHKDAINKSLESFGPGSSMSRTQYGGLNIRLRSPTRNQIGNIDLAQPSDMIGSARHLSSALEHLHTNNRSLVDDLVRRLHAVGMKHNIPIGFRHVGENIPRERIKIR